MNEIVNRGYVSSCRSVDGGVGGSLWRYGSESQRNGTIIASQLPVAKWHEYLNEPTIADAILDRLVPKAHRVELKGKSLRTKSENLS